MAGAQPIQDARHAQTGQRSVDLDRDALPRVIVDDVQGAEGSPSASVSSVKSIDHRSPRSVGVGQQHSWFTCAENCGSRNVAATRRVSRSLTPRTGRNRPDIFSGLRL
jgi:hypothetical protein